MGLGRRQTDLLRLVRRSRAWYIPTTYSLPPCTYRRPHTPSLNLQCVLDVCACVYPCVRVCTLGCVCVYLLLCIAYLSLGQWCGSDHSVSLPHLQTRINVPSYCDRVLWKSYPGLGFTCLAYGEPPQCLVR